jgi:hypothetical protein
MVSYIHLVLGSIDLRSVQRLLFFSEEKSSLSWASFPVLDFSDLRIFNTRTVSSHHFVKEGQEPALVILEAFSLQAVEPLLEWAPLVVVSEKIVDDVLRWGIKIDVVAAKKEHIEQLDSQLSDQGPVKFLDYTGDLISAVFEFLIDKNQSAVTIVSNSYEDVIKASQPFGKKVNVSILTTTIRWSYIAVAHFKKWFPANSTLLIRALASVHLINPSEQLISDRIVTTADGIISLESSEGFWVGELVE